MSIREQLEERRRLQEQARLTEQASVRRIEEFFAPVFNILQTLHDDGVTFPAGRVQDSRWYRRRNTNRVVITVTDSAAIDIDVQADGDALYYRACLRTTTCSWNGPQSQTTRLTLATTLAELEMWLATQIVEHEVQRSSRRPAPTASDFARLVAMLDDDDIDAEDTAADAAPAQPEARHAAPLPKPTRVIDLD